MNEKEFSLFKHPNNLASYGELSDGWFINVGCMVFENRINYAIISSYINYTLVIHNSYFHHTYIHPFHDKIITAIFSWLLTSTSELQTSTVISN